MKKTAAFFDFDGTVLTTHTARLVGNYLRDRRLKHFAGRSLSLTFLIRMLIGRAFRRAGLLSETAMAAVLLNFYRGRRVADVEQWAGGFYLDYVKPRLSAVVLDIIRYHRKKGHVLVLVSGQVRTVLVHVAADLGFDHIICTDLQRDRTGRFTGRPAGVICVDSNKKALALAFAGEHDIDLSSSFSYGNNEADEDILAMVGHPVAVEPTKRLEAIALERRWRVVAH
jgi:HAD superfamily hydrolase (TIGR01490 family)